MERYEVDLYQLNCSVANKGDAAIALLVLKGLATDVSKNPPLLGTIKSAVLIDGGSGTKTTAQLIEKTMIEIERTYTYVSDINDRLKLDAVVISRLDAIMPSMVYLKYDNTSVPPKPLSTIYLQWPFDPVKTGFKNSIVLGDQFKLCQTTDELLGRNVFNAAKLTGKTWDLITDLSTLITSNDPWNGEDWSKYGGTPGLYVVGANSVLIGNTTPVASDVAFRSVLPTTDPASQNSPVIQTMVINDPGVLSSKDGKNPGSLVLLLVWKNKDKEKSPKVSLYTAGDAEWPAELKVANFIRTEKIQVIKGGHHGSAAGTGPQFIEKARPDHVIYSAGVDHGHPVPEIILYLDAWFFCKKAYDSEDNKITKKLHAPCYPYQLGLVKEDTVKGVQTKGLRRVKNKLTDPDKFTNTYKDKKTSPTAYANYKPPNEPGIIQEYTIALANYVNGIRTANGGKEPYNPGNEGTASKEQKDTWAAYQAKKCTLLQEILVTRWENWSKTTYDMYPTWTFNKSPVLATFVHIDYVYVTFSYQQSGSNDSLQSTVQLRQIGNLKEDMGSDVDTSKAANIEASDAEADKTQTDDKIEVIIVNNTEDEGKISNDAELEQRSVGIEDLANDPLKGAVTRSAVVQGTKRPLNGQFYFRPANGPTGIDTISLVYGSNTAQG
ncbi:uncharacterized protein KY384_000063 [Bacidia gigantensis]|uniref:uncharacterized protein n=1 Tax=Bacidia gigantensis TaxID=2732470 RepID=UPI001D04AB13|nr:uncharacterized protein KY384_000063 [Bacidia gigantensis]KAG8526407.1 hypothetical protein KY384_000063 [Bacidia gigantensis]